VEFDDGAGLDTSQVQDVRGGGGGGGFGGFGGFGGGMVPIGVGGGALGVIVLLLSVLFGGNLFGGSTATNVTRAQTAPSASAGQVASQCRTGADANANADCRLVAVVNSVQSYWQQLFESSGLQYQQARTRLFTGGIQTGCGAASSAMGPFYCPADGYVYLDTGFFDEFRTKFGYQGGAFAEAYVVAHEYGHHVQDLLGTTARVERAGNQTGATSPGVRLELQADCYAGVWAKHATTTPQASTGRPLITSLTDQDITDGLDAAARVGDDYIQKRFQGRIDQDTWTHGSSAQRQKWFRTGYDTGDWNRCDTFSGAI
jgi:predicted metalloprotease